MIAAHLILSLYGHWAVNDPRGSGSARFLDLKFEPLAQATIHSASLALTIGIVGRIRANSDQP